MKRLYRSRSDRIVAGVCGGLGAYLGLSPVVLRGLFILLSAVGGFGVPLYLILWILIPDVRELQSAEEERLRRQSPDHAADTQRLYDPAMDWDMAPAAPGPADWPVLLGVILVAGGLAVLFRNLGLFSWLRILAPIALVALGIALLIEAIDRTG